MRGARQPLKFLDQLRQFTQGLHHLRKIEMPGFWFVLCIQILRQGQCQDGSCPILLYSKQRMAVGDVVAELPHRLKPSEESGESLLLLT